MLLVRFLDGEIEVGELWRVCFRFFVCFRGFFLYREFFFFSCEFGSFLIYLGNFLDINILFGY